MAGKPGRSGRKRDGGQPKVNFNTKIDPDLRDQLQAAADAANRSLSREIELRLQNSLVPAGKVDDATRALCLLIIEAAKQTADGNRNWSNDNGLCWAFTNAVKLVIAMVYWAGRPKREASLGGPFEHPAFKSSDDLTRAVVYRIAADLAGSDLHPYDRAKRALGNPSRWLKSMLTSWASRDERQQALPNQTVTETLLRDYARRMTAEQIRKELARVDKDPRFFSLLDFERILFERLQELESSAER